VELGYGRFRTARESAPGERVPRGRRATRAAIGHAAKAGLDYAPRVLRSFRLDDAPARTPRTPTFEAGRRWASTSSPRASG
jgi:large subunit ribosomal protein L3